MDEEDRWSSIDSDILLLISSKITSVDDYIRFSAVCRSWHSSATDPTNTKPPSLGPLYLSGRRPVTLRDPTSGRALTLSLDTAAAPGRVFWGSPFGWLVAFDLNRFTLLNPFSRAKIELPGDLVGRWDPHSRSRGFLTASPDSDPEGFAVLVVSEDLGKVALFKPGKEMASFKPGMEMTLPKPSKKNIKRSQRKGKWTYKDLERGSGFDGAAYFRGDLYGIRSHGTNVVSFRNDRFVPVVSLMYHPDLYPSDPRESSYQKYLVELNDQLCLCVRYESKGPNESLGCTQGYKFFEIDLSTGKLALVASLGDLCVFINPNYSFSCKASYPPARLFEQQQQQQHRHGFVSSYVFYYWGADYDTEVWDVSRSCVVHERRPDCPSDVKSFWIVPPMYKANALIQFH